VVEVESHPEVTTDFEWLMSDKGSKAFAGQHRGTYRELAAR
jgi:hypothetical protein